MKKAVIVFTKVPKVGEVKTRLTEARGGIMTPQEANDLYEACVLDVIDICLSVNNADIWICYNHDGDRTYLNTMISKVKNPENITGIFHDMGGHFDDCMQYAADFILKDGSKNRLADAVIIVGGDLPTFQPSILQDALSKLESLSASEYGQKAACRQIASADGQPIGAAVVEGACQEGGFSLIGYTCTTAFDFHGVFYNLDGIMALDMLVNKVQTGGIPLAVVETAPDVDIPLDLASVIPVLRAMELASQCDPTIMVPQRTIDFLKETGIQSVAMPPARDAV